MARPKDEKWGIPSPDELDKLMRLRSYCGGQILLNTRNREILDMLCGYTKDNSTYSINDVASHFVLSAQRVREIEKFVCRHAYWQRCKQHGA